MVRKMKNEDLDFSSMAKDEFKRFELVLKDMFIIANKTFMDRNVHDLENLRYLEDKTDKLKEELSNAHFERIKKQECKNELSPFHSTLLSELERVADHLTNIGYSIVNPTGDEVKHTLKN